jgi:hypothetical protein
MKASPNPPVSEETGFPDAYKYPIIENTANPDKNETEELIIPIANESTRTGLSLLL